ncbi:hypothetical protein B0H14DRAFT_3098689 [Mycena olivaceomarginata]|nr:hypothetical protein B0H14DRAFT_3098689 [Mycena olivaceomarginata]
MLQSVVGIFLHASNTPSKFIKTLAHLGISISLDSINNAVHSLFYAYDNFDIDFANLISTVEKSTDTLTHMTSGGLIYLVHGVKEEDLKCSAKIDLHPEADHPSGLTCRKRFNAWIFLLDLITYGPDFVQQFRAVLGKPEMIEQIPVVKMRWAPARSLDIKQSTVAGNLKVILILLEQGGVGDPTHEDNSIWENDTHSMIPYVILFHGDLGTG